MRIGHLVPAVVLAGVALTLAPAAGAATTHSAPTNFGQHVRTCAQTMDFSGEHNPGMHHGAAGWNGMPCQ
jgi:hypothetical protein